MATVLLAQLYAWRSVLQNLGPLIVAQVTKSQVDNEELDASPLVLFVDAGRLVSGQCDVALRSASEALSTLTLFARVDIVAWSNEVCAVWPQADIRSILDRSHREIVMGLKFEFDTATAAGPLMTRMLLEDGFSPEFRALLAALETATPVIFTRYETGRFAHPLVPVDLTLVRPISERSDRSHVANRCYVATHNSGSFDPDVADRWRCIDYTLFSPHAQHNITCLEYLAATQIQLERLIHKCELESSDAHDLRRFFAAFGGPHRILGMHLSDLHLKLPPSVDNVPVLRVLCSALASNRRLHVIRLVLNHFESDVARQLVSPLLHAHPTCRVEPFGL